jgi:hypothetical protein
VDIVNNPSTKLPSLNGFWSQEYTTGQGGPSRQTLNGVNYLVYEIKKVALFPQHAGTLQLDAASMKVVARVKSKKKRRGALDDFFNNDPFFKNDPFFNDPFFSAYEDVPYSISSGTVNINVKELPGNKPADFTGAVGRFNLITKADKTSLSTDDAITYKATISGSGNLPTIENPNFVMSPDFEVYDPKVTENIPKNSNPIAGSKTYEYVIVPRIAGSYAIPEMTFTYFDLDTKTYKTLRSVEIPLQIKQGKNTTNSGTINGIKREDLKLINQDIRFIKLEPITLKQNPTYFYGSWMMYMLGIVPFLMALGVLLLKRKESIDQLNGVQVKNRKALKLAKRKLSVAEKWMKSNEEKKFYDEVQRSLWGYVADKFNVQTADLSHEAIREQLVHKSIEHSQIEQLFLVIDNCEMALYAPTLVAGKMKENYDMATAIIVKLEQQLNN